MDEFELADTYKWVLWVGSEPIYGNDYQHMVRQAESHGLTMDRIMSTSAVLYTYTVGM
jgi:hypothetical protein